MATPTTSKNMPVEDYGKFLKGGWNVGIDRHEFVDNLRKSALRSSWRETLRAKKQAYNTNGEVV